jgi:hypothetical protein
MVYCKWISLDNTPLRVLDGGINGKIFLELGDKEVLDGLRISLTFQRLIKRKVSQVGGR